MLEQIGTVLPKLQPGWSYVVARDAAERPDATVHLLADADSRSPCGIVRAREAMTGDVEPGDILCRRCRRWLVAASDD